MEHRHLTDSEIAQLEMQSCSSSDWARILIHPHLDLKYVRHCRFSGDICLGKFEKTFILPGGIPKHSGLFHATLHNVHVGDDCCIEHIKNYIANYDISSGCFIENVDIILVDGETSFGNGVEVTVLNETGGREVTLHDALTAHEAYIEAIYRHRPLVVDRLKKMAEERALQKRSSRGFIGENSTIVDAGYIKNLYIGAYTKIEGAGRLKNGTLNSRKESPIHIGYGVIADDFIVQDGSSIEDSTTLTRCYVGQSCTLGHGYSASDSLFFCNCQEENGEACAIFAGPFTVTHHKSTLLIAGMFSFMNAGSGSNQSNHMYKLGPIHQGAMERGAKTASDSYILWPARIGAFSLVMGRHTTNPDTSNLPFSYLIEKNGDTYLVPAVNLRSVGTIRDVQKWPKRDKRTAHRLDSVNFNLLSPYTIARMLRGIEVLENLKSLSGKTSDTYAYQSAKITNHALNKGLSLYRLAVNKFLGNSLISRLEKISFNSAAELLAQLPPSSDTPGRGEWLDLSGLIAPKQSITDILNRIESGEICSIDALNTELSALHSRYYELEWTWAYEQMLLFYQIPDDGLTVQHLHHIIAQWKSSVITLDEMLYADAQKEFSLSAKTGFGFDGSAQTAEVDFEQVRGAFEHNPFVREVKHHIERKSALGDLWLQRLHTLL